MAAITFITRRSAVQVCSSLHSLPGSIIARHFSLIYVLLMGLSFYGNSSQRVNLDHTFPTSFSNIQFTVEPLAINDDLSTVFSMIKLNPFFSINLKRIEVANRSTSSQISMQLIQVAATLLMA